MAGIQTIEITKTLSFVALPEIIIFKAYVAYEEQHCALITGTPSGVELLGNNNISGHIKIKEGSVSINGATVTLILYAPEGSVLSYKAIWR